MSTVTSTVDTALRTRIQGTRPVMAVSGAVPAHLVNQALFWDVLLRERRRADRSNHGLVLVTVASLAAQSGPHPSWDEVADALCACRCHTDIVGWVESGSVLGLLACDIPAPNAQFGRSLTEWVRGELAKRSDVDSFSIRLYTHRASEPAEQSIDRLLSDFISHRNGGDAYRTAKRALDLTGSLALLVVLCPLFVLLAALVKLTSIGPVFFRQQRVGARGRPFTMLKFRSMYDGADSALHHEYVTWFIRASGRKRDAGLTATFKLTADPRITRVGSFLRKTSLDELPQLWNVLRGEMSLVGPRPPLPYEVEQYQPWHHRRVLDAKPGITGLWQVTGRSRTTFDDMVRLDLRYARTRSLWTDLKILLATPAAVIAGKGAC